MYEHSSSWNLSRNKDGVRALGITRERIQRQLAAVIELNKHNSKYLEPPEISWITHLISEAVSVTFNNPNSTLETLQLERAAEKSKLTKKKLMPDVPRARSRSPSRVSDQDEIELLLETSRQLNSANSLLSCCYDRWSWLGANQNIQDITTSPVVDFRAVNEWRKQSHIALRTASSQNLVPISDVQPPQRHGTNSTSSSRVVSVTDTGSDISLSLRADETIERWRCNAEQALNETTTRMNSISKSPRASDADQHLSGMYQCRPCMTQHERPLFFENQNASSSAPQSPQVCTHRTSISSTMQSKPACAVHNRTSDEVCDCSQRSPQPFGRVSRQDLRPSMRKQLQNSFDKEPAPIEDLEPMKPLPTPPQSPPKYYAAYSHSRSATMPQISPMISQATLVTVDSRASIQEDMMRPKQIVLKAGVNTSSASVQTKSSASDHIATSRGRRWLEHHG